MEKKKLSIIGQPTIKLDAGSKVTGEVAYGQDLQLPNMLYAKILRTEHPCATIESIDISEASALPGVIAIITADDIDVENIGFKKDHPILKKEALCIRDEIAAVAATSEEIAKNAINLIKVNYNIKEGIYDLFEAIKEDAPLINTTEGAFPAEKNIALSYHYEHGDLAQLTKDSAVVISKRYTLPRVTHCCMGPSTVTANYLRSTKELTIYSSTQVPFLFQRELGQAIKIAPSRIRVIQPTIGGAFGSKLDLHPFEPICVLLSMKTGQPVQLTFDREEEFIASPTRQPMIMDLTTGADKEGNFTFKDVKIFMDNGAYVSWGATTPFVMMQTFSSLYKTPACSFDAKAVYTNNIFAGSFRGFGNPQASFALEANIDLMAEALEMDKGTIREINANFKGETTGQGMYYRSCAHKESLKKVIKESGIQKEKKKGKEEEKRYKTGMGIATMMHVGGGAKMYASDGCGTILKMDDYGILTIISGSTEIGQGSETVLAMMAAEELGLVPTKIKVINSDTDIKPWDVGVHASRTSYIAGNSLLGACKIMKKELSAQAAQMLKCAEEDLLFDNEKIINTKNDEGVNHGKVARSMHFEEPNKGCMAYYYFEPQSEHQDKKFMGDVSDTYAFAAQIAEVEVDTATGNVRVLNFYAAQDVGKVLNPLGLSGQIEGGIGMGIGYALSEEMIVKDGIVLNPTFHDYKLLTATDMPDIHFYPIESMDERGPYGAKGVAEAPLIPVAAAIANAVSEAIGTRIYSLPLTPEKVLKALSEKKITKDEKLPAGQQ